MQYYSEMVYNMYNMKMGEKTKLADQEGCGQCPNP